MQRRLVGLTSRWIVRHCRCQSPTILCSPKGQPGILVLALFQIFLNSFQIFFNISNTLNISNIFECCVLPRDNRRFSDFCLLTLCKIFYNSFQFFLIVFKYCQIFFNISNIWFFLIFWIFFQYCVLPGDNRRFSDFRLLGFFQILFYYPSQSCRNVLLQYS